MTAPSDTENTSQPGDDVALAAAAKMMIPPPPGTEAKLQDVDPRRLRGNFQRGIAALAVEGNFDDQTMSEAARLVSVAAILGYEPARAAITRDYPRSSFVRSAVSSLEAVRYSLDPLFLTGPQNGGNLAFVALLASYFSGRHELEAYTADLLAALRDDRRLQTKEKLATLFVQLSRVRGACTALARAVVKARIVTSAECSSELQLQIENFIRTSEPLGREAESRREALRLLDSPKDIKRPAAR